MAGAIGLGSAWTTVSNWARWPVFAAIVITLIVLLHRYGPDFQAPLRWYLPGAVFAIVASVIAGLGLGIYFRVSGGFSEAYGAFGAVLAFVFFLFVQSLLILLGGLVNSILRNDGMHGEGTADTS